MEVKETSAEYLVPQFKRAEAGDIPMDWLETPIGEMADVTSGGTPSRKVPAFWGGNIPWVTTAELDRGEVMEASQSITTEGLQNSAAKWLPAGTLLIALYGQGKTRGKCGVLRIAATTNQACAAIRIANEVDSEFVRHSLTHRYEYIRGLSNGGSQENLSGAIVKQIRVGMPPTRAEQNAIASALSDADNLIDSLERLLTKKRQIKQGAMQDLLTGKRRLPGFSGHWQPARFGEAALIDPENLGSETRRDFAFNYIALEGVDQGRLTSFTEVRFESAPSRARRVLRTGDVLVSTVRPNLKSHLLFETDEGKWIASTGFSVVRSKAGISSPGFLFALLFSSIVEQQVDALLTGSNYPAINGRDVANLKFASPPFEEQVAIAQVLSNMDAEISALESRLTKARALKQAMAQALLTGRIRLVGTSA